MAGKHKTPGELRLQHLRSFCETARLGSLTAAAQSLGLTQPTIGEQVHALERAFGAQLVETHGRGCRLTEAGKLLIELAGPLVTGIDSLPAVFREANQQQHAQFTVASSPRVLAEDILPCLPEFERQYPDAQVSFLEVLVEDVAAAVESGRAQLGLSETSEIDGDSPWIEAESGYELDLLLVTPSDHPLAARRRVTLEDIAQYPVVNAQNTLSNPAMRAALLQSQVFQICPSRVHVSYTVAVRKFVKLGFGVGFVLGLPGQATEPELAERSVSQLVGHTRIDFAWRKGAVRPRFSTAFADCVKRSMERRREAAESSRGKQRTRTAKSKGNS